MLNIILTRYLANLRERNELDWIFAPLLQSMGYQILDRPSQGQPENGKDYVTLFCGESNKRIVHFQIKAGVDKDISSRVFTKEDGIRESLLAAKDAKYRDLSQPELDGLPVKIVLVHTGTLNQNCYEQFNGFIDDNFNGINQPDFERWDLYKLADLFSEHLFNEFLFTESQISIDLLKKTLALLGTGDTEHPYYKELIRTILSSCIKKDKLSIIRLLSTLNLIGQLIFQYSQEIDNLHPAKEHVTYLILQTWGWLLENHLDQTPFVIEQFAYMFLLHYWITDQYLDKFKDLLNIDNGLYSLKGSSFETIAFPLRCTEIINCLLYHYWCDIILHRDNENFEAMKTGLENLITKCIFDNVGSTIPLFDNYSVTLINIIKFFDFIKKPDFVRRYLQEVFNNIAITKQMSQRLPELKNNMDNLIEFIANDERPIEYWDSSSYLLEMLFEISLRRGYDDLFKTYFKFLRKHNDDTVKLLVYHPPTDFIDYEHILFQHELITEGYTSVFQDELDVESDNKDLLIDSFKKFYQDDGVEDLNLRTESTQFLPLVFLAHSYYLTPWFPSSWRS